MKTQRDPRTHRCVAVVMTLAAAAVVMQDDAVAREMHDDAGAAWTYRCTLMFDESDLQFDRALGGDVVGLKGGTWLAEPGRPLLPARMVRLAVPEGVKVTGVSVIDAEVVPLDGTYAPVTAQTPLPTSQRPDAAWLGAAAPRDDVAAIYPAAPAQVVYQTDLAGQSIAVVKVCPVQYRPAEKKLALYQSMELELIGDTGYVCGDHLPQRASTTMRMLYESLLREAVVNPDDVRLRGGASLAGPRGVEPGDYDYVIITQLGWDDEFAPLAEWKTKKGTPAAIVTVDWIYNWGGYSGSDVDKIRQFVIDAHDTWGAMYFLLGGDSDTVPCHERYLLGEDVPNDTFYGDYDDDWTCEVYVGRASVRSAAAVETFVAKALTCAKNPPLTDYPKTAFFMGFDMASSGSHEGEGTKTAIKDLYLPDDWMLSTEYDGESGSHLADVIGYLNDGNSIVNHVDHCYWDYIGTGDRMHDEGLSISDMENLNNGERQSIFYTIGCWPCAFTEETCIAEAFVRNPNGGGVAFVGNTRYGWFWPYSDDGYSLGYDRAFFSSLFEQNHWRLGVCFSDHKGDYYEGDEYHKYIFSELTLLGDPELWIWTEQPSTLDVVHDETLTEGEPALFAVEVTSDGAALSGATVCLWKDGDVYEVDETDSSGQVSFSITPETIGTMAVTAVGHNYLPYEGEAEVIEDQGTPGDLDGDGDVDVVDLLELLAAWGECPDPPADCPADLNGDGVVDVIDLLTLLGNWT